jgi:AcrR family transcriptional regulator
MTKQRRDSTEVEKIRESIIERAVDIIRTDGFSHMTMRKIASKTGMSATNLYNYFSSKDEIYIHILIRGFRLMHEELNAVFESDHDPLQRGKNFVKTYLMFGIRNYNYYEIMFSPGLPKYADYVGTPMENLAAVEMEYSRKIIELSVKAVTDILKLRENFDPAEVERRMIEVWSMLHGMISLYNSKMIDYAISRPVDTYDAIVEDLLNYIKT